MIDLPTGSANKRIAKNTLVLYLRMGFVMVIQLYISRIILDRLGESAYGVYSVVGGLVVILSFINTAMVATTQRFMSFELGCGDQERLRLTFSQAVYAHLAIGFIFVCVAESLGLWFLNNEMSISSDNREGAFWVYQFSIASFVVTMMQVPFGALITAHERLDVYAVIGVVEILLKLGVALSLSIFDSNRLIWYGGLLFGVAIVSNVSYAVFCRIKYSETHLVRKIDLGIFKSMAKFAGWSIFGSLAWIVKNQGINVVLNLFTSTLVNAAYGIAMQVSAAVSSFVQNFMTSVNPQLIKSYASRDYQRVNLLLRVGGKLSFMLLYILAFPLFFTIDFVLDVWLTSVPQFTAIFVQMILIVALLESFTYVMGIAIQATGRIKAYQLIVGGTLLLNLPIAYVVLQQGYPPYFVMFGGIFIGIIALIERIILLQRQIPMFSALKFFMDVILRSVLVVIVSWSAMILIQSLNDSKSFISTFMTGFCIALVTEYILGLSNNERRKINVLIKNRLWIKSRSCY